MSPRPPNARRTAPTAGRRNVAQAGADALAATDPGALAAALAASKPGGLFLASGSGTLAAGVAGGLDATARLVALVDADEPAAPALGADLRVAVHRQPLIEFLHDVERYRFDVIALAPPLPDRAGIGLVLARAAPGALLLCAGSAPNLDAIAAHLDEHPGVRAARPAAGILVAACGAGDARPRRRGGRAGRRARDTTAAGQRSRG